MKNPTIAEQSLDWLLASATDAMLIIDGDGAILLANPALERLFGYDPGTLQGQPVEVLIPQRYRHGHGALRADYARHPRPRAMGAGAELHGAHRDGREFPVEVSLSPLRSDGAQTMVMATIHDISARKAAERALQESEARMRAVFETAVDAIITIDERGILERLNPAAERMFGYTEAEVAGRNISMLMPSPHRKLHDGYLAHYLATGEKRIIGKGREVRGLRRDGSVFPMDLAVAEMTLNGRRMFTGLVRDITERRQAEEKTLQLLQEVSSANEELTNFAYVVSHDLKAPLRGIGSLADWLATDYADKFNDEGKEHMRLLINRVHRMGALIDGILQYSRVGRVREAAGAVDLNRLLADVVDLQAPPAGLRVTVQPGLPTVVGEPTRLQQVFQNLLSNAVKYIGRTDGEIHIGCADDGAFWRFSVADNGPGIEPRHFERIFQLFQTLAPRDRVESTGVGLALVKKIVEMYRGRVWVESAPGAGATFLFTWPKAAGRSHQAQGASTA
ncbi:sensor histidine kinase [Pseudoduganella namucuonensis]|uniref:Sensor protein FixL n=1 Tax=Pseudoduganella namucuonensis TaxID=1035707 RepID=A0A1I7KNR8_9BURK|nr:PAS domain-containing sensor histidine kinase [Pseudoduganella namucuonensis]SFU99083.1 PAS/PAC sensor signal transduction histidine kinase [Pseudoduganella namucuonensis]